MLLHRIPQQGYPINAGVIIDVLDLTDNHLHLNEKLVLAEHTHEP
jgi:hypothetical protein